MFKKRETPVENIAFISIMSAIIVVIISLATLIPFTSPFIILFLPFLCAVVFLNCKPIYYLIFSIACFGLSMAFTFYNNELTLFYLIPSLLSGFIFAFFIKKEINPILSILLSSIVQCFISILILYIMNFIYSTDFINNIIKILKLEEKANAKFIILPAIYVFSFIQEILSYIILMNEIKKFNININIKNNNIISLIGLIISFIVIPLIFINLPFAYLFMFMGIVISIYNLIENIFNKNVMNIIFVSSSLLLSLILFFVLFKYINMPFTFLILNISNILIMIYSFIYNLIRGKKDARIS